MSTSRKKLLRKYIEIAERAGWRVEQRKCNHWGFFPKDKSKSPVFTGGTPTDHRSLANLKSQLRKAGLNVI